MLTNTNTVNEPIKKKRRWFRYLFEALLIVGIVFGIRAWQQKDLVVGEAPSFQSVMLNGETVNLEDYRGKPFILHFWASWCPFCKIEEGSMSNIQKDWPMLSVAYQSGDKTEVKKHMEERGLESWPTIVDKDNRLGDLFGVKGVPTSYIIDGEGNIRFAEVGLTSAWGLRARLWWADKFKK
ncbi:MAG: protein disulfide oxidoreductase [Cocleimonas sp.]